MWDLPGPGIEPVSPALTGGFFFFFFNLFLAVLGLSFCARAFSSCGKRGPLFIAELGPLTVAASPIAGHRLQTRRLSSCGPRAQLLRGVWDLPRPGLKPVSPASAGRLSTTAPPGKPLAGTLNQTSESAPNISYQQPVSYSSVLNGLYLNGSLFAAHVQRRKADNNNVTATLY